MPIIYERPWLRGWFCKCGRALMCTLSLRGTWCDALLCIASHSLGHFLPHITENDSAHLKNSDAHVCGDIKLCWNACFLKKRDLCDQVWLDCSLHRACFILMKQPDNKIMSSLLYRYRCKERMVFFMQAVLTNLVDDDCNWSVNLINNQTLNNANEKWTQHQRKDQLYRW